MQQLPSKPAIRLRLFRQLHFNITQTHLLYRSVTHVPYRNVTDLESKQTFVDLSTFHAGLPVGTGCVDSPLIA